VLFVTLHGDGDVAIYGLLAGKVEKAAAWDAQEYSSHTMEAETA
jgi:hypothetical protein